MDWNILQCCQSFRLAASHPSWVCGLKQFCSRPYFYLICHTLRGCVDWNYSREGINYFKKVTPFVGVWIEAIKRNVFISTLKVTPFVGVWIETSAWGLHLGREGRHTLRGCVDWNLGYDWKDNSKWPSHPSWVCGLKLERKQSLPSLQSHTLRGCVDWNWYLC